MLIPVTHHQNTLLPESISGLQNSQTGIPRIAKDKNLLKEIEAAVQQMSTTHRLVHGNARKLSYIDDQSIRPSSRNLSPLLDAKEIPRS